MAAGIRAFVAIALPETHRVALAAHLERCARLAPGYRWVAPESLHVTLRFLGSVQPATLETLRSQLEQVRLRAFRLALGGRGAFGSASAPRVVWLGLSEGGEACARLAGAVEDACRATNLEADARPFHAHVTLARARANGARLPALPDPPGLPSWWVAEFVLYESRMGGGRRPTYLPIERFPLDD